MRLWSMIMKLWHRSRVEDDMAAEMRSHIQECAEHLTTQGLSRREAERRARIEFGSIDAAKEEARKSFGFSLFDGLVRDLRYSARGYLATPGWTAAVIVTLALCIGANTAIFSIVDAVLLRPLPYPHPERLVQFVETVRSKQGLEVDNSHDGRMWLALKRGVPSIDAAVYTETSSVANYVAGKAIGTLRQQRVSTGFFRVLGVPLFLGREFTEQEDTAGGPAVAILSYAAWKRDFQADPSIVGTEINVRGEPHTVIGVTAQNFRTMIPAEVWTPVRPSTTGEGGGQNYGVIGRLHPAASFAEADAQAASVGRELLRDVRISPGTSIHYGVISLQRGLTEDLRQTLGLLWAAVVLVLIIGCLNIAGLVVVRHLNRTREIATRIAIGGGRIVVIRQLLLESFLIGSVGAIAGVAFGYAGISAFDHFVSETLNVWQNITLDGRVLLLTIMISLAASVVFGLFPALQATRIDVRAGLSDNGGRTVAGERKNGLRRMLVVCEIALGVMLIIGATLVIRTFNHFMNVAPGFDGSNLVFAKFSLQDARYASAASIRSLMDRGLTRINELPAVESAAAGLCLPYERPLNNPVTIQGQMLFSNLCYATPGYFKTLKVPILEGRDFNSGDQAESEPVAIVNETFVRRYLGGKNPVGRQISLGRTYTIIGVAGAILFKAGFMNYEPLDAPPGVFISVNQPPDAFFQIAHTWFSPAWIVRTTGAQEGFVPALRQAIQDTDRTLPIAELSTVVDLQRKSVAPHELNAGLMGLMAALALVLAIVGIYGLVSNSVVQRQREMGIRLALGASAPRVVGQIAREGVVLATVGAGIGLLMARFATQFLKGLIFGVSPTDVMTFVAAAAGLVVVASVASLIPSLRAASIDPAVTLKAD